MMSNNRKVQLSICEFITSQSTKGVSSAKNYPSGSFLDGRYVKSAKINSLVTASRSGDVEQKESRADEA